MSDESALLAAILAYPDEDTPRLMYADWLDENGQPERAEFIRLQCAGELDEAAEERLAELEERNRVRWLTGFPQFLGASWEFRRGFPDYLSVSGELMLERYDAFARVPWLRSLHLCVLSPWDLRDFANRPWARQWVELDLTMTSSSSRDPMLRSGPAFTAFAKSPQLLQLRRLCLSLADLDAEAAQAVAGSPYLGGLQQLRLFGGFDDSQRAISDDELRPLRERFGGRLVIGWG